MYTNRRRRRTKVEAYEVFASGGKLGEPQNCFGKGGKIAGKMFAFPRVFQNPEEHFLIFLGNYLGNGAKLLARIGHIPLSGAVPT